MKRKLNDPFLTSDCRGNVAPRGRSCAQRSGVITFWMVVSIPIFLIALAIVLEVGNLWVARIQLNNALESSALATVQSWGKSGASDTAIPRSVGNAFSSANIINGQPVDLAMLDPTLNYTAGAGYFQNNDCGGVFVFGTVEEIGTRYRFNTCQPAVGCGSAFRVLFDVTVLGEVQGPADWGISFQPAGQIDPNLAIVRVTYELPSTYLRPSGRVQNPVFDLSSTPAALSPNLQDLLSENKVRCSPGTLDCDLSQAGIQGPGGNSQADVYGIGIDQVEFLIDVETGEDPVYGPRECTSPGRRVTGQTHPTFRSKTLTLEFCDPANGADCSPFQMGDRLRFGAKVVDAGLTDAPPSEVINADDIGRMGVRVTVCFSDGTSLRGMFVDTVTFPFGPDACPCSEATFASWGNCETPRQGMIVHPAGFPDVPLSESLEENNDEQSLAEIQGQWEMGSGTSLAVRVQARTAVPSVCSRLFGFEIGPFHVQSHADALFDCSTQQARLYHLESTEFRCQENCP